MSAARDLERGLRPPGERDTVAMHLRGHTSDLASNAELYATQLEIVTDALTEELFGRQPRDVDSAPNVKPIPPQSIADELSRLDLAVGRIGASYKRLAELRARISPEPAGGAAELPTTTPYREAPEPGTRGYR